MCYLASKSKIYKFIGLKFREKKQESITVLDTQLNFFAWSATFEFGGIFPCKTPTTFLPSKNNFAWKFLIFQTFSQGFRSFEFGRGERIVSNTVKLFLVILRNCFFLGGGDMVLFLRRALI